ncbi:MAG: hypothetical protein A2268_09880 [Candidatus Raymondbacteria bacterium RifOxyA12_full_50_37]|uniref:Motility protein n=1 Tax=Candidatus Raymondbacteria bacterium RIFOXYD12_FULL_49_13 TaxID=1817890 RepID=A0A1F7F442_UNCRA|nr:MAG: hypothetical protein A2268_09880 [Candidatus Raymondbacteria bacterium RifOxyA12_full_50_37]OGJ98278.1 MAG: hypothetical protein A2453_00750 [Candidatus Raymondbacteria bacterium RIFOXYC2_FULL_50_21]OGK01419.1 MAG: hypothetical protein A2519_15025 [Candidatus Raymondbacteria bacterium RIFOXYD12_FULL_49_13]OGP45359.1 MAG: hypothetical protein A2324_22185 [Candidatus Raymondbacteria bacterium RIFOXYB2_FULL_49_35]
MEINSLLNALNTGYVNSGIATKVASKANEVYTSEAQALINSIPKIPPSSPNQGQNVDFYA